MVQWMNLPLWQARKGIEAAEKVLKGYGRPRTLLALVPAVEKVRRAQARLDQRIAYLRVIEAVRLYAHDNGGRLPDSLDTIPLPLPADPVGGKAFAYSVKDGVATLTAENSDPARPETNRVYELRMRK